MSPGVGFTITCNNCGSSGVLIGAWVDHDGTVHLEMVCGACQKVTRDEITNEPELFP